MFSQSFSSAGKGQFRYFLKTTYRVRVNLQEVAGGKKFSELLPDAINFTGYRLIRRTLNNDDEKVLNSKIIVCMKEGDHKKTAGGEIICYSSTQSKGKSQQNSTHTKSNMTIHIFLGDLKH